MQVWLGSSMTIWSQLSMIQRSNLRRFTLWVKSDAPQGGWKDFSIGHAAGEREPEWSEGHCHDGKAQCTIQAEGGVGSLQWWRSIVKRSEQTRSQSGTVWFGNRMGLQQGEPSESLVGSSTSWRAWWDLHVTKMHFVESHAEHQHWCVDDFFCNKWRRQSCTHRTSRTEQSMVNQSFQRSSWISHGVWSVHVWYNDNWRWWSSRTCQEGNWTSHYEARYGSDNAKEVWQEPFSSAIRRQHPWKWHFSMQSSGEL